MSTPGRRAAQPAGKRTAERSAFGLSAILAVVLPLLTAAALAGQAPADDQRDDVERKPVVKPLLNAEVSCQSAARGGVLVGSAATGSNGTLTWRSGESPPLPITLKSGTGVVVSHSAVTIHGADDLASGLFGARPSVGIRPAAIECTPPSPDFWLAGAGAGANHLTTITLINPDPGLAVADFTVWGPDGEVDASRMRGVVVPGRRSVSLPLGEVMPVAGSLGVQIHAARGRLSIQAYDRYAPIGIALRADGMSASAAPGTRLLIPGLTRGATERLLTLVNPGDDEARVRFNIVGTRTTFAPTGLTEVPVPAGSTLTSSLAGPIAEALEDQDASLEISSTVPILAGVRSMVLKDLVQYPALSLSSGDQAGVVPTLGVRNLVVTTGDSAGAATLTWVGGPGGEHTLNLVARTTRVVAVPAGVTAVRLRSSVPLAAMTRGTTKNGIAVLPLRPLLTELLVPVVRPEWPPS